MQSSPQFTLVPLVSSQHLELVREWVNAPHVLQWWPDFAEQLTELEHDESDGESQAYIALMNGEPLAFLQTWQPTRGTDYPWQHELDESARGIDLFIGEEAKLSKGYGSRLVRFVAVGLKSQGASRVLIDPSVNNACAIRCYEKAGFKAIGRVKDCDGESLLMEFKDF